MTRGKENSHYCMKEGRGVNVVLDLYGAIFERPFEPVPKTIIVTLSIKRVQSFRVHCLFTGQY